MKLTAIVEALRRQKVGRARMQAVSYRALEASPHDLATSLVLPASGNFYVSLSGEVEAPVLVFNVGAREIYVGPVAANVQVPIGYFEKGVTFECVYTNNQVSLFVQGQLGNRISVAHAVSAPAVTTESDEVLVTESGDRIILEP